MRAGRFSNHGRFIKQSLPGRDFIYTLVFVFFFIFCIYRFKVRKFFLCFFMYCRCSNRTMQGTVT